MWREVVDFGAMGRDVESQDCAMPLFVGLLAVSVGPFSRFVMPMSSKEVAGNVAQ
jgi:hypothetical protein